MTCQHPKGKLISQTYCERRTGTFIYRRKECPNCGQVFSTEEREVRPAAKDHPLSLADLKMTIS